MHKIEPFAIERFFAQYEFTSRYLLSCSDCEPMNLSDLLAMSAEETMALWRDLKLSYTESTGHPLLRTAIAGLYRGMEIDDLLVTVPEEGIFLLMQALLAPGDHVICTFPGYQSLYELAKSIGCDVTPWEPNEDRGWHFELAELEKKITPKTRLVVANFPHNPTGFVPSCDTFEQLIRLLREKDIYLLSDEMYRFLEFEKKNTLPSACERYDNAVSLYGLSKAFGLPGLRIGWVVSKNKKILDRMAELKDYTTICASAPSEILATIALKNREKIINLQRDRIQKNITVLDSFFSGHSEWFTWNRPLGGSICFPRLQRPEGAEKFCKDLASKEGIMLVPSGAFNFGDRHVRMGFGRKDLPEVIERLSDYLKRL